MRMFPGKSSEPFTQHVAAVPRNDKLSAAAAETVRGIEDLKAKVEALTEDRTALEADNHKLSAQLAATRASLDRSEQGKAFFQNAYIELVAHLNTAGNIIDDCMAKARESAKKLQNGTTFQAGEAQALRAVEQELTNPPAHEVSAS